MKKKKFINVLAACCFFTCLCANCSDTNESGGTPYDASKPVTINGFYPDSGGFATRIIIEGSNFGNKPEEVRVWFNDKQASVIGTNGDHLYAVAPRTPGDTCIISVAVGNDSTSISHPFIYRVATTIITVAGQKGVNRFAPGTLATATFGNPRYLAAGADGYIYGANWKNESTGDACNFLLNEEKDIVMQLPGPTMSGVAPTVDVTGKILIIPEDPGDGYVTYDADLQWTYRRKMITHPSTEDIAAGKQNFTINWKVAFTTCQLDGMVYTSSWTGDLVKFDPFSNRGELVIKPRPNWASQLCFHPVEKEVLYLGFYTDLYSYNTITGELKHIAGTMNVPGYRDGPFEDALFNDIGQFVFDENNDIILADGQNHCIRKLNMKDRIVTTLIGKGGVAGYQDGNPDDALFNRTFGMCIDKDYNIYIADYGNNCIRKLVTQ
jgi:hypothetical protein